MINATKTSFVAALAGSALAFSMPAFGQDTAGGDGGDDTETATLLAYLGLTAASGQNTVGEGAGGIEGHMLAAAMAMEAAEKIVKDDKLKGPVILLNGNETLSLGEFDQATRQIEFLESEKDRFAGQLGPTGCPVPAVKFSGLGDAEAQVKPSDLIGAFRTSSNFTPVSVTFGPQLFKNAMLAQKKDGLTWVIPGDVQQPTGGQELAARFVRLREFWMPYADGKCDNEAVKKAAATQLARVDGLAASKDGAPSLLDRAALAESILSAGKDLKVLRVDVDRAGGTLVNSSNVFTTLGFPGVTIRGGLVVSYRLTNPTNGQALSSGIINCRVPKKRLQTITSKAIDLDDMTCKQIGS
jgi:hypothetical protein